jgi:hypothetical protein
MYGFVLNARAIGTAACRYARRESGVCLGVFDQLKGNVRGLLRHPAICRDAQCG